MRDSNVVARVDGLQKIAGVFAAGIVGLGVPTLRFGRGGGFEEFGKF